MMKKRFWWAIVDKKSDLNGSTNLVWTQLKQNFFFNHQRPLEALYTMTKILIAKRILTPGILERKSLESKYILRMKVNMAKTFRILLRRNYVKFKRRALIIQFEKVQEKWAQKNFQTIICEWKKIGNEKRKIYEDSLLRPGFF